MSSGSMRLKEKIRNYAKENGITAQVVLQNYMFERFLVRLSSSSYSQNFIIKGGILVAAIVGLDTRSTMDLDATIRNLPMTDENMMTALTEICSIKADDGILFHLLSLRPIRREDPYGGLRAQLEAVFETIVTPLSVDISTGDIITPNAVRYEIRGMFDDGIRITLWGYSIETVPAEKIETILSRGIFNTRSKDFYDIYILTRTTSYDPALFTEALQATSEHRGSKAVLDSTEGSLQVISESIVLQESWNKYRAQYSYASDIPYENVMSAIKELLLR